MANDFDQATRFAAKLDPPAFVGWLLPGLEHDYSFRRWLDTRTLPFPGEPDRTCDTVAELGTEDPARPPIAVVIEFQSRPAGESCCGCWSTRPGCCASCRPARVGGSIKSSPR